MSAAWTLAVIGALEALFGFVAPRNAVGRFALYTVITALALLTVRAFKRDRVQTVVTEPLRANLR